MGGQASSPHCGVCMCERPGHGHEPAPQDCSSAFQMEIAPSALCRRCQGSRIPLVCRTQLHSPALQPLPAEFDRAFKTWGPAPFEGSELRKACPYRCTMYWEHHDIQAPAPCCFGRQSWRAEKPGNPRGLSNADHLDAAAMMGLCPRKGNSAAYR